MLNVKKLTKNYGKSRGINNINFDISKGTIFGFIGPNGAGKSTTIRCIMDLINASEGEILLEKTKVGRSNEFVKSKENIGYLPSEINLYEELSVKEMIEYNASFYSGDCLNKAKKLVEKFELEQSKKIDQLSMGNLKKLGIVLALMHSPKFIILDEPTNGLDPLMQEVFYEIIMEEKQKGNTIFLSSHNLNEIKRICDRIGIIKNGELINIESIDEINDNNFVIIKISSNNIKKIKKELKCELISESDKSIMFMYNQDINNLIKKISKFDIESITIENPSIEEVFKHYYE